MQQPQIQGRNRRCGSVDWMMANPSEPWMIMTILCKLDEPEKASTSLGTL